MSAYIEPLKTALLIFPFLALFISSFFFIYEYRKFGRFIFSRALIMYSFVFYLLCAYFLVILPLPPISEVAHYTGPHYELHLGASLHNFLTQTVLRLNDPSTYLPAMKQGVFLEPVFNVFLLLPFGVYLRYFFGFSLKKTILASFLLSLFFEVTQLTGLYFIYPRNYRLADVNDLLHNTIGGTLGYLVEPLFTLLLPSREELAETAYEKGRDVTLFRRFAAFFLDWFFIYFFTFVLTVALRFFTQDYAIDFSDTPAWYFVTILLYFILLNYGLNGQTLGKKIVRIRVVENEHRHITLKALVKRYGLLYLIYGGIGQLGTLFAPLVKSNNHFLVGIASTVTIGAAVIQGLFVINVIWSVIRKKRQLFYEKRSGTYVISTILPKEI